MDLSYQARREDKRGGGGGGANNRGNSYSYLGETRKSDYKTDNLLPTVMLD